MYILQLKVILNKICCIRKNYGKIDEQVNQMEFQMGKLFLTQHLGRAFSHMEKMDTIKVAQSAVKENEVFKLRQEAVAKEVAKERIAQDQPRQERIIQEQTTLRVEQERIALEKLTLKADQEALQRSKEILAEMKIEMLAVEVNIQRKLKEQLEQKEQLECTKDIIQDQMNKMFAEVTADEDTAADEDTLEEDTLEEVILEDYHDCEVPLVGIL